MSPIKIVGWFAFVGVFVHQNCFFRSLGEWCYGESWFSIFPRQLGRGVRTKAAKSRLIYIQKKHNIVPI